MGGARAASGAARSWSIRAWLILLVLATIAPLAAYGLLSVVRSYAAQREQLVASTASLARELGSVVERALDQQMVGVEALAGDPALADGDLGRFAPTAAHYLSEIAPGARLLVSDAQGAVVFDEASQEETFAKPAVRADPTLSARLFATGRPSIALVRGPRSGKWFIALDAPVMRDGRVVRDLTLHYPVAQLQAIIARQNIPREWTAIVTDPDGRLVARLPPAPEQIGAVHTPDVLAFLASRAEVQTIEARMRDGEPVIGGLTRTPQFGWVSGVAIPRTLVLAPLRASLIKLVAVGMVALTVSVLLALAVAHRLARPIRALADMAARFDSSDDIPPAPPPALREADEVARVLELSMRRRRAAEEAANEAELRASQVIEDAPCGVVLFGPDGSWRFVNQATCDLLGRPAEELLGLTVRSPDLDVRDKNGRFIPVEERASARALRGETVRGLEVSMKRGDGGRAYMLFNSAPLRDRAGRITGALTAMLDISDRKAAEDRLARFAQELETRVEAEVAAREAAQLAASQAQKMQALGQLAGGVAHDFNNVLQAISGAVSLIEARAANPDAVRRFARTAAAAAERGAAVAGRLLSFARRSDLVVAPLESSALLSDTREILAHTLGGDVTVNLQLESETGWLLADRAQLETALVNLGTNARDAMAAGGTLTLRARREQVGDLMPHPAGLSPGAYVRIDVEDTGVGMDAATLARATEPFFTTKPMDKGTGLGLAMVRGFAEQLNGGLVIASRLGVGTIVSLWLPATNPPDATAQLATPTPAEIAPGLRVLLVDDEPEVRTVLAEELAERGWVIEQVACAEKAIELLREASFDVLVADQSMPGDSGVTLIGHARRLRPGLPAILLTGLAPEVGDELTESGEDAAITEVATKPIRARELARRIERLLARARVRA
ncbi:MAG TPA: ATP-binding protein [Acetobacteraceae bacterium]|nr:ATP-binding protein [Acetobacteraceae bacterium]